LIKLSEHLHDGVVTVEAMQISGGLLDGSLALKAVA
jgi:hypothetical protein